MKDRVPDDRRRDRPIGTSMTNGLMTDKADEGTLLNFPDVLIGIKLTLVRPEMEVRPQVVVMMTAIIRTVLMVTYVEDGVGAEPPET